MMDDYHPSFPSFEINEYADKWLKKKRKTSCSNTRGKKVHLAKLYGCICIYCQKHFQLTELTIDHRIPRSRGGSDAYHNLALACAKCNSYKGCLTEEEYRRVISK